MATVISIVGHKGGVGKTTTAASLGGILSSSLHGKRVLLVDLDAQKNLTETFLTDWETGATGDAADIFAILDPGRGGRGDKADVPIVSIREGLDIIPASERICGLDMTYGSRPGREFPLKKALAQVAGQYDIILVDSPAQIGIATSNAITAADWVIMPVSCDAYSMGGLNQILDLVDAIKEFFNPDVKIAGILKTKFSPRRIADSVVDEQLREVFGDKVFATYIRDCSALVQAPLAKKDILSYDARCNGAQDYQAFAEELLKVIA